MTDMQSEPSGLGAALERVGDRWTLMVVEGLLEGARRFGDLQGAIAGIAPNVLSQRLKQLERDGIVRSRPYSQRPVRFEYELTEPGKELGGALRLLAQWGARHTAQPGAALRHRLCDTELQARWWCPTCARAIEDSETDDLDHL